MNIIEKIKDEKVRHIKRIEDLRAMIDEEYCDYERKIEDLLKELDGTKSFHCKKNRRFKIYDRWRI